MPNKNKLIFSALFFIFFVLSLTVVMVRFFYPSRPMIVMSYFVSDDQLSASSNNNGRSQQFRDKLAYLNVIAYAFLKVSPDGRLIFNENDLSPSEKNSAFCRQNKVICKQGEHQLAHIGHFDFFTSLHNQSNHLKKIISLGGADDKTSFFYAINNADNFVNSVRAVIDDYNLAGLDFDFELNRPYKPDEAKLYADLITKLRKKLGSSKIISMASIIDQETLQSIGAGNWRQIATSANFISMMCYDLVSPYNRPEYTQFASNLYVIPNIPKFLYNANSSCDQSIRYLTTLGVPAAKIVLGIPAYAISYGGVGPENNGLFQPSDPTQTPVFDEMGRGLLRYSTVLKLQKNGFTQHLSMVNGNVNGAWLYNSQTRQFITFDNPESVRAKMDYVLNNNLAGVMMWRIGQDAPISDRTSLLKTIVNSVVD